MEFVVLELLPLAALGFAAAALGLELRGRPAWQWHVAAGASALLAFLFLLGLFVAGRVDYENVFLYTRRDLALRWRIAGSWAGREGSMMLWGAWLALVLGAMAWLQRRRSDPAHRVTRIALAVLVTLHLLAITRQGTFDATPAFFLEGRPDGAGINPTLRSGYMLIHPPLMFLAYALAAVPAAAALGHWATGHGRWSHVASTWTRPGWLLYTFAMGLGALWAYTTLGFGGYWAWDPVEVANLLPWLALTLYLHAQLHHRKHGAYAVVGPFLALLPLLLTIFSTVSTRSGLWVSVHAFTDPTNTFNPDAPGRFLDILAVEPGLLFHVGLFAALVTVGLGLWAYRLSIEHQTWKPYGRAALALGAALGALALLAPATLLSLAFEAGSALGFGHTGWGLAGLLFALSVAAAAPALAKPGDSGRLRLDMKGLAYMSVLVLSAGLLILFLFHNGAANGWSTAFYEKRLPWIAAPALVGITLLQVRALGSARRALQLSAAAALVALAVGAWLGGGAALLSLSVIAILAGIARVHAVSVAPRRTRWADSLLLGAAWLDVLFWVNVPSTLGFGTLAWRPPLGVHLAGIAIAAYVLWGAHRIHAGAAPKRPGHVHLLAGALGGFWIAAPLAAAAWWLRPERPNVRVLAGPERARMRLAALHGVHLAVTIALAGYAASTYWKEEATWDLEAEAIAAVGPFEATWAATDARAEDGTPYAAMLAPELAAAGAATGTLHPTWTWDNGAGAHIPRPATLRGWRGDLYVSVDTANVADDADCMPGETVQAFQPSGRLCTEPSLQQIQVSAVWLPAIGLVWLALALFVVYMAMLMRCDPVESSEDAA